MPWMGIRVRGETVRTLMQRTTVTDIFASEPSSQIRQHHLTEENPKWLD